ncbi:response regulator [Devosia naphthalenivorans]|uniref:response regulator n=1 Tax=Devosia naphthalenivorans TaxID=2082392 RepID=UPI0013B06735|nr:response regulator [Devosia naphthalenivorans]
MNLPRILYVEDNFLLALPVEIALEEAGYEVITVTSAEDALLHLEGNDRLPDLLLTDIRLPGGPDGWAIAQRARELLPLLPVIYASGDSAEQWGARGVPGSYMLRKPFSLDAAIEMVRRFLS